MFKKETLCHYYSFIEPTFSLKTLEVLNIIILRQQSGPTTQITLFARNSGLHLNGRGICSELHLNFGETRLELTLDIEISLTDLNGFIDDSLQSRPENK